MKEFNENEKHWFQEKKYLFTPQQLSNSLQSIKPFLKILQNKFLQDNKQQQKSKDLNTIKLLSLSFFILFFFFFLYIFLKKLIYIHRWYVGIRSEPTPSTTTYQAVLSGEAESIPGLSKTKIIHKFNHLTTIDAWTLEHEFIKFMFKKYPLWTFNKSFKFGLGPIPPLGIQNTLYTLTLIRGITKHQTYRAYEKELPSSLDALQKLVKEGDMIIDSFLNIPIFLFFFFIILQTKL